MQKNYRNGVKKSRVMLKKYRKMHYKQIGQTYKSALFSL